MAKKEEGKIVDIRKRVTVYATAKAPYHKEGDEMVTQTETAAYFVKKGYATEKAPTGKAAKTAEEKTS